MLHAERREMSDDGWEQADTLDFKWLVFLQRDVSRREHKYMARKVRLPSLHLPTWYLPRLPNDK